MLLKKKYILLAILFCFAGIIHGQNKFVVEAPKVVAQDEVFRVVFTADGEMNDFIAPTFDNLNVLAGPSPSRMSSVQIINGKRSDAVEMSYTYIVRPVEQGGAKISGASATINGKTYTTRAIDIDVVAQGNASNGNNSQTGSSTASTAKQNKPTNEISSDDIFLRLTFNKTKVVKGEPIIATLKLFTKVPISGFEDIKFPVFNGFWSQEIETPQNINFERENVGNQIYNAAVLRKYMLLPQQTGSITIAPAEMICQIQQRISSGGGRSIFDDFFDSGYQNVRKRLSTKNSTITVSSLPAGAPASFGGGVGNFKMSVKLAKDNIKAHEASSLIVDIQGSGNLNLIETPKVNLPADFEQYDVKINNNFNYNSNGVHGMKSFEFPFIPRSEGNFVIPPIEYTYYNIADKKYVTLRSDSLRINVAKGDGVSAGPMIQGVSKQSVTNLGEDIRYIYSGPISLFPKNKFFVWSPVFLIIILIIISIYFALYYYLKSRIKFNGDIKRVRNKKANKVARARLKLANSYMSQKISGAFYEEMHKALLGYIGDKLSIQFADMQRDNIKEILVQKGVDEQTVDSFIGILEECEMARYSPKVGDSAMEALYDKAMETISNLENTL